MQATKTQRGFDLIEFVDTYGSMCSLQKSSSVNEDRIWLGSQEVVGESGIRMHLNQEQVKELLPYLERFVETGEIIPEGDNSSDKV